MIKKEEVDVYHIPIEKITGQYMEYLDVMRMLDLNLAGDYLVMAATLMMIKSRMLLPEEQREEMEEDEDDPRWDLVKQLVEYKKFKDAAVHLQKLEEVQEDVFVRRGEGVKIVGDPEIQFSEIGVFDLISAFNAALQKVKKEELKEIFSDRFTVAEKVDLILELIQENERVSFLDLVDKMVSRSEMVCTFLAILELIRLKQVQAKQEGRFGDIWIVRHKDAQP